MFVQWNETYALNIPQIDNQHKQLFLITNQLFDENQKALDQRKLIPLFKQLYGYTRFHFSSEEGILRQAGYKNLMEHKEIHKSFTAKIREYLEDYRRKPMMDLEEPLDFLVKWIITHISGNDREYATYLEEKGIKTDINFSPSKKTNSSIQDNALELWEIKKLQLNITDIDNQHKELVYILQQMNDLQKADLKRRMTFLPSIIEKLFYYSQYHFSYEEQLMSSYNYPETLAHRGLHHDFILRIQDFVREYKLNKESLSDEIVQFLHEWVTNHILVEDKKYKQFLR